MKLSKMKDLDYFFEKAHWAVTFAFGWALASSCSLATFAIFTTFTPVLVYVKCSAAIAVRCAWVFVMVIDQARKSRKFWECADSVSTLINQAETREQLSMIFATEMTKLAELALGGPHYAEVRVLYAIAQTKLKCIENFSKSNESSMPMHKEINNSFEALKNCAGILADEISEEQFKQMKKDAHS